MIQNILFGLTRQGVMLKVIFASLAMLYVGKLQSTTSFVARGKRISAIAAISCEGLVGVELTTGSVNAEKFLEFVQGTLIPEMEPFDGTKRMVNSYT